MSLVSTIMARLAYDLHEGDSTFATGNFGQASVFAAINQIQLDFINRTGILKLYSTVPSVVGTSIYTRASTIGEIDRISYDGKKLERATTFDLDHQDRDWRTKSGTPRFWHEDLLEVNQYQFDRIPTAIKSIRIISDTLPTAVTATSDSLTILPVFDGYLQWGVLSLLLSQDGDNQDIVRAKYAKQRYERGIAIAKQLVDGTRIQLER